MRSSFIFYKMLICGDGRAMPVPTNERLGVYMFRGDHWSPADFEQ